MYAALLQSVGVLLVLGPVLTAERPVDEPVWWPAGDLARVLETPTGFVLTAAELTHGMLRVAERDGGFGPIEDLGPVSSEIPLVLTSQGLLALYLPRDGQANLVTRLFDPATGQPVSSAKLVAAGVGYPPPLLLTGPPGHLLWTHSQVVADAGLRTFLGAMSDDGTPRGAGTDLTDFGSLSALASSPQNHWAALTARSSDGGQGTMLATVTDDGAPTPVMTVDGLTEALVATTSNVALVLGQPGQLAFLFVSPQGTVVAQGTAPVSCWNVAAAARDEEVWLGCSESASFLVRPSTLRMFRLSPDGGTAQALVLPGDGGEVAPAGVVTGSVPALLFSRVFSTVGRGEWKGVFLLPLSADGLSAAAPPVVALERPNAQFSPSFAALSPAGPYALAWSDDRQLPYASLLEALTLSTSGEVLRGPEALEPLTTNFTNANPYGRMIASDGRGFLVTAWNGFGVTPIEWPTDGGAPLARAGLTLGNGVFGPPLLSGGPAGYYVSWNNFDRWVGRPLDSHGVPLAAAATLTTTGAVCDVKADGARHLQLIAEGASLRLVAADSTGALSSVGPVIHAGGDVAMARFARSGSTYLVAWQEQPSPDVARILAVRLGLDAGVLDDAPKSIEVASHRSMANLGDVGVRNGVFHLFGTADADGGPKLWIWRLADDGGAVDSTPSVFDDQAGVNRVVAGPALDDGTLLFAYARGTSQWGPEVQRVYLRAVGDSLETGSTCSRDTDCSSGFCVEGVCCESSNACSPGARGPQIYRLTGCDCDGAGGPLLPAALFFSALPLLRRLRRQA